VPRKIFEPTKAEASGYFSMLCIEELHELCRDHSVVRTRSAHRIFVGKIFFKWPKGSHRTREDNIMIYLR